MVVTYYIKLFQTGADRRKGILMSLPLPVAETAILLHLQNILMCSHVIIDDDDDDDDDCYNHQMLVIANIIFYILVNPNIIF